MGIVSRPRTEGKGCVAALKGHPRGVRPGTGNGWRGQDRGHRAAGVGEEPARPDPIEAVGHDMEETPLEDLGRRDGHRLDSAPAGVIFPPKADPSRFQAHEPIMRNDHARGEAPEKSQAYSGRMISFSDCQLNYLRASLILRASPIKGGVCASEGGGTSWNRNPGPNGRPGH